MQSGSIGAGHMGASMGTAWAAKGHTVLFSFAQEPNKLRTVAAAAGPHARTGTPAEAVACGDII
jgi:predicted dinucleotide-binding enzyme